MSVGDRWWDPSPSTPAPDAPDAGGYQNPIDETALYNLLQNASLTGQTPAWFGYPGATLTEKYQNYIGDLATSKQTSVALQQEQLRRLQEQNAVGAGGNAVAAGNLAQRRTEFAADQDWKQVDFEAQQAKAAADQAYNSALLALKQGDSAEARRQFDLSSSELKRSHDLDFSIAQQKQDLAQKQFGFDVYKDLSDKASNPRNYMEQFFRVRGQEPPANAGQYSNQVGFEQFLNPFLQSSGLSTSPAGAAGASSPAAPASPYMGGPMSQTGAQYPVGTLLSGNGVYGNAYSGANHFNTDGTITLSPDDPDAPGLIAKNPGMYKAGGAQEQAFLPPKMMARGGTVTMNVPHALVNMLSGRVAAIAGEAGKEHARFDGAAIIDPFKGDTTGGLGDPAASYTPPPGPTDPSNPYSGSYDPYANTTDLGFIGPSAPSDTTNTPAPSGNDTYQYLPKPTVAPMPSITGAPMGPATPFDPSKVAPPAGYHWVGTQLIADATTPSPTQNFSNDRGAFTPLGQTNVEAPRVFGPQVNPGGGNAWGGPVNTTTAPSGAVNYTNPALFAQTPSGLGQNPQFLPEDAAQKDPLVKSMIQSGTFAPFLQRLYAQQAGLPGLGTNVPQQTNLPNGLPLASRLALSQMNPAELSAFQSFVSAHGLDWNDYLNMVDEASPHGGSQASVVPKFLSQ